MDSGLQNVLSFAAGLIAVNTVTARGHLLTNQLSSGGAAEPGTSGNRSRPAVCCSAWFGGCKPARVHHASRLQPTRPAPSRVPKPFATVRHAPNTAFLPFAADSPDRRLAVRVGLQIQRDSP